MARSNSFRKGSPPQGSVLLKTTIRPWYFCWISAPYSFQRRRNTSDSAAAFSLR